MAFYEDTNIKKEDIYSNRDNFWDFFKCGYNRDCSNSDTQGSSVGPDGYFEVWILILFVITVTQ